MTPEQKADRRRKVRSVVKTVSIAELAHYGSKTSLQFGTWPTCGHCGMAIDPRTLVLGPKAVDAVELVDQTTNTAVILAKCHGQEEALRVDFGGPYEPQDMSFAWRALCFFQSEVGR